MGCIYLATNTVNGRCYVGQTVYTMEHRRRQHEKEAKGSSTIPFYRAIRKYGSDAFVWTVLHVDVPDEDLNRLEVEEIEKRNCRVSFGYNLSSGGSNGRHAEISKLLIATAVEEKWQEPGYREQISVKVSKTLTGRKQSEATKEKRRRPYCLQYGEERAREIQQKQSQALLGLKRPEEFKVKMREVNQNLSPQAKENQKAGLLRFNEKRAAEGTTEEHRKNLSISHLGYKQSEETKAKKNAKLRDVPKSPETVANMKAAWVKRKQRSQESMVV